MITLSIAPLVMLAGLIIYFASTVNAKLARVGEIMFWIGLFFTLWTIAGGGLKGDLKL